MADELSVQVFIAEYIGAFVYWMLQPFNGKLSNQLINKKRKRNIWTGYFYTINPIHNYDNYLFKII